MNVLNKGCSSAKIADCGLSRMLDSHAFSSNGTSTFHGTSAYAAPELLLGYSCSDKSDMYSLKALLWEVITHEKPSRGQLGDFQVPEECSQSIAEMHEAYLQLGPEKRPSAEDAVVQIQQAIEEHEFRHDY